MNNNQYSGNSESEHLCNAFLETVKLPKHIFSKLEESIEFEANVSECPGNLEVIGDQIFNHAECRVFAKFRDRERVLPNSIKELSFLQFAKIVEDSVVYRLNREEFYEVKSEFDISDLDYGYTDLNGFVRDPGQVFPGEISAEIFNNERWYSFFDRRLSMWSNEYEGYPFTSINKNLFFYLFFCARIFGGKEIPVKCWEWGFSLHYNRQEGSTETGIKLKEVKGSEMQKLFEQLYGICQLPNGNTRLHEMVIPAGGQVTLIR